MKRTSGRSRRLIRSAALTPTLLIALGGVSLMPSAAQATEGPINLGPLPAAPTGSKTITLITGDIVRWSEVGGTPTVSVEDKGPKSTFETVALGDGYYVFPSDVRSLLDTHLDRELFNVAKLVEDGYTDDEVNATPVILTGPTKATKDATSTAPGWKAQRRLSSVNGAAGTVAHARSTDFGKVLEVAAKATAATKGTRTAHVTSLSAGATPKAVPTQTTITSPQLQGVAKIWLDGKVEASLDKSVPQTGAPAAWAAGYDGSGQTVAVLDTGVDLTHPDLQGVVTEAKNFTDSENTVDHFGHGTHVAATVAGTGKASNGARVGVAKGAKLIVGKTLGDNGKGQNSWLLAGMEWASSYPGVNTINLSLGSVPTDGTDPMSQAVNTLSDETGRLFVIAAGNDGPGDRTVDAPSTADKALTVGAIDANHNLASFSSRGPRRGDWAVKPEITAPGVNIVAARAEGTTMGTAVDQYYTKAGGTSMATPHVAGAAAIIKQQHPDWDNQTIKSVLINSAIPNPKLTVYQQGGGELAINKAITTTVTASPGALNLGYYQFPHANAAPVVKKLTYTNHGKVAETLHLSLDLKDSTGKPAAEGMVTLSTDTLTIAPGATASVDVTLDRRLGVVSLYSGMITAKADSGQTVGTPVGLYKEEELYDITVKAYDRTGKPADDSTANTVDIVNVDNLNRAYRVGLKFTNGAVTTRVAPGNYSVMTRVETLASDGTSIASEATMGDPQIKVTKDTTLVYKARDAQLISVSTKYPDTKVLGIQNQYIRKDANGMGFQHTWSAGSWPQYVRPTDPVTIGEFGYATKLSITSPKAFLDLNYPEFGRIPASTSYTVTDKNTARRTTKYYADVPGVYGRANAAINPWETKAFAEYYPVDVPTQRIEVESVNETRWKTTVSTDGVKGASLFELPRKPKAGVQPTVSWYESPRVPSQQEATNATPAAVSQRTGDTTTWRIFEWGDSNPAEQIHYGSAEAPWDSSSFRLYQDGELWAKGERGFGTAPLAPSSRLRAELDVSRQASWWTHSTETHTAWEFDTKTTEKSTPLPLMHVDYRLPTDLTNTLKAPQDEQGKQTIGLSVRVPAGAPAGEIKTVKAWLSYDGGMTWNAKKAKAAVGGGYTVPVDNRDGSIPVSIKVKVVDSNNTSIEQSVIDAFSTRPAAG